MELQWPDFCCIDVPFYIVVGSTPGAPIENPGDSEGTVTLSIRKGDCIHNYCMIVLCRQS